ncbi:MAG: HAD family phosphatase [Spartobacteria bacterium]|nr:HAD family phosphatase [Spartobacteria bacterium]
MLTGVCFDFDGIIVDTEPLHYQAFEEVIAEDGLHYTWAEYVNYFIGFDDRDGFRALFERAGRALPEARLPGLIDKKAKAFMRIAASAEVRLYPGVEALLKSLRGHLPLALCSGALRSDVDPILNRFDLASCFDVMVTAEEVRRSKPDPESYLLACARMKQAFPDHDWSTGRALAIEDTPAGIASAQGAGLSVLAITNSYSRTELQTANIILDTLEGIGVQDLNGMVA